MASFEARTTSGAGGPEQFAHRVMVHPDFPEDAQRAVERTYATPDLAGGGNELAVATYHAVDKDYTKNMIAARLKNGPQDAAPLESAAPPAAEVAPRSPWHGDDLYQEALAEAAARVNSNKPNPPVEGNS